MTTPSTGSPRSTVAPAAALAADAEATAARLASLPFIPGLAVAAVTAAGLEVAAGGVLDVTTSEATTAHSHFRPGSVTKLVTSTLVMQLVDEGLVGLDDHVLDHVKDLELAGDERINALRVRHLISHTSGIDAGDLFLDTGEGDDALDRYLEQLHDTGFLFEPGRAFSYNNAGFAIAGVVVQRRRDMTFEEAAHHFVFEPLGMTATRFLSGRDAEATLDPHRAQCHTAAFGMPIVQAPDPLNPMSCRSMAPAGGTLESTAGDMGRFVAAHMGLGDVPPVVTRDTARLMRQLQMTAPGGVFTMQGPAFAWMSWENGDGITARIGGGFPGQSTVLIADERHDCGLAVMTNSDNGINAVTAAMDASGPPSTLESVPVPEDLGVYVGEFRSHAGGVVIELRDGSLHARAVELGAENPITPIDGVTFASSAGPLAFFDLDDDGRPRFVRWRMRVQARIS